MGCGYLIKMILWCRDSSTVVAIANSVWSMECGVVEVRSSSSLDFWRLSHQTDAHTVYISTYLHIYIHTYIHTKILCTMAVEHVLGGGGGDSRRWAMTGGWTVHACPVPRD